MMQKTESTEEISNPEVASDRARKYQKRRGPREYEFLGATFHPIGAKQALARTRWMTSDKPFRYIVTPNVDHIVRLTREPEVFTPLYNGAWLSVCDSRILELLANIAKVPLSSVPGSDLTAQLFETVITTKDPITVIGAEADVVEAIKSKYGLTLVNHHEPPMGLRGNPESIAACAQFIKDNPARFVFICVGSPQQEMVAKAAAELEGTVGLGLCIGASLDFLTGKTKRAPKWVQRMRMEWLFRLLSEPRRLWKRYLVDGPKIFLIWRKWSKVQGT